MPRRPKLVLQALRWLLLGLAAMLLLAMAALLAANWRDDPLRPEIAPLMRFEPPEPDAMRRNGYFTLLGLGAPAGDDANAAGQRFVAAQVQGYALSLRTREIKSTVEQAYPGHDIDMQPIRCLPDQVDCLAQHLKNATAIRAMLAQQASLVERYLSLQDIPTYEEVMPAYIGVDFPRYQDAVAASELVGMHAALLLHEGHHAQALALWQRNASIHQQLMSGARTLVGAMVALAMEERQLQLLSSALRHDPAMATENAAAVERLLAGHTPLAHALEGEMKFTLAAHGMVASGPSIGPGQPYPDASWHEKIGHYVTWPLFRLAYLPNASLNHVYLNMKRTVALSRLPAEHLQSHAAQALREAQQALHGAGPLPFRLRNFWGNVLLAMSGPDLYLPYLERAHDVDGHRRLILLQLAAMREGVAPAQMPAWLAAQPPALRNPYTLAPMGWDAGTQSLVFEGRQPQNQNPARSSTYRVRVFNAGTP